MVDALHILLEVQGLDTQADQLTRRRSTLPQRAELAALGAEVGGLEARRSTTGARASQLGRDQKRLEDDVATLEAKAAGTDRQLYSGTVTAPRELQALQDEAASLRRRIGALEDQLLVVMEDLEPVAAEVEELDEALAAAAARAEGLRAVVAAEERAIDDELAQVRTSRAALVGDVPADLVARYERIRARAGGVGIARLDGHRCTGCHLELPNREVDELRRAPADQVVLHEECGRILVRS